MRRGVCPSVCRIDNRIINIVVCRVPLAATIGFTRICDADGGNFLDAR